MVFIASCKMQKATSNYGTAINRVREFDSLTQNFTKETIFPDMKIWYKDSLIIETIRAVNFTTDNGITSVKTPIAYYVFFDRTTKAFYHYSSFSDTAQLLMSYTQSDSVDIKGIGGWPFYLNRKIHFVEPINALKDTTINNVLYKRIRYIENGDNIHGTIIAYFRCDKKGSLLQLNVALSD
jgi:uncharacterized protein YlzI (FlbEa/FlbD family)